ncbi:acetamidase [Pseudovirgaria hyperparasitica]|uniref:Acetamidase n=1 Tax=Pseudovirgaria hyperparasitica TaxID=470096 RepID=A0A6A6W3L0_9PEZI|nr:acetamidase [Pseudovirgaria hyperparasitica]KAF2757193.1 acetamidase [Pseudovirgaria hyperparasitica]
MTAWEKIGLRKRAERAAKIPHQWRLPDNVIPKSSDGRHSVLHVPRECGLLTDHELDITENYDATALSVAIKERRLKCVDVTRAFCKRAAIAQQLTNCLTEILFSEALVRAKALDAHLDEGKPPLSALHGIPISLKDSFKIPGVDASIGIAALCFEASSKPSSLVEILLKAGAVLYCKTNVPQTLGALDSFNNVFGRTLNPHNAAVTAGGSTGGEGALIALRGSVLGVGTDAGGSIRIPAMVNGIYGVKPSWQRIPYYGQESGNLDGHVKVGMAASAGPLAVSFRDCELFLHTVVDLEPWLVDSDVIPGPWSSLIPLSSPKITVGLIMTDGLITPHPPVTRTLREAASALTTSGIHVVELDVAPLFSKCQALANRLMGVGGNNHMFDLLERTKEPLHPWLVSRMKRHPAIPTDKAVALHGAREAMQRAWLQVWAGEQPGKPKIDVLLCPVAPHAPPEIDRWNATSYCSTFNMLDYPAGTIPVRIFEPEDVQGELPTTQPIGSWDKANRALWNETDRSVYIGTPLCVQVVAPNLQERRLCEAMRIIDDAVRTKYGPLHKAKRPTKL